MNATPLEPFRFPGVRVVSGSDAEPVFSLETLYRQCELVAIDIDSEGVESHPDDALLLRLARAALLSAEKFTGLCLIPRRLEMALDQFPGTSDIEIPRAPFVALVSLAYGYESDAVLLQEGEDFTVDPFGNLVRLRPFVAWPNIQKMPSVVRIIWEAGYSLEADPDTDREPMPEDVKSAILLTVEHLYKNRGATTEKALAVLPLGVEHLLRPHRVLTGFA